MNPGSVAIRFVQGEAQGLLAADEHPSKQTVSFTGYPAPTLILPDRELAQHALPRR